ncbi:hypothetical protein [Actinomyces succiniciruminis]|uniref:Uncharacterized protein n=1 Tax=Actinomyces succiniciruminis TaxID=1522002 RepID=A0A1L7RLW6_9ACTO|nr:hypothetical protein [Actinomyces succiniciruminis]CED90622.1 Hypothetical protein AAM4_0790 [Actinomyces succiniciruminis]
MATFTTEIDDKTVEITTNNPTEIVTLTAQGWKREPDPEPADTKAKDPKPTTKAKPKTEVKAVEGGK